VQMAVWGDRLQCLGVNYYGFIGDLLHLLKSTLIGSYQRKEQY